jgi:hypothetical protein
MSKRWKATDVFRTTKCFSPRNNGYPGGFPLGFLKWCREQGWWGEKRCYLCAGGVVDEMAVRVDIRPQTNPTHCEDARHTSLPDAAFDCVIIDPPYSKELAERLYDTAAVFSSVNAFAKEARRIAAPGALIVTLSYEVPKRIRGCNLVACCGVYQTISVAHMRCLSVWRVL